MLAYILAPWILWVWVYVWTKFGTPGPWMFANIEYRTVVFCHGHGLDPYPNAGDPHLQNCGPAARWFSPTYCEASWKSRCKHNLLAFQLQFLCSHGDSKNSGWAYLIGVPIWQASVKWGTLTWSEAIHTKPAHKVTCVTRHFPMNNLLSSPKRCTRSNPESLVRGGQSYRGQVFLL